MAGDIVYTYHESHRNYHTNLREKEMVIESKTSSDNLHVPGAKDDKVKPDLELVLGAFAQALMEVGEVGTFGARKYTRDGWLYVNRGVDRYSSALLRHFFQYKTGEFVDSDSKLSHLAHVAWNALAILELSIRKAKEDKPNNTD